MKELLKKVLDKFKAIGKEIYFFISSQIFLKNIGGIVVFVSLLLFFTLWWMRCYTKHGESLQVHDYTSMNLYDAIEKANSRSFEIIVNDSSYRSGMAPNVVLTQSPKPFSRVKEDRKIYISITKTIPDLVPLPSFSQDDDFNNYNRKLKALDLKTKIKSREFRNRLNPNTILEVFYDGENISEQIPEGFKVPKGSIVEFIVSERGGGTVAMPDLVCMEFSVAEFNVKNYGLNIGAIIPDASVTDESTAYVWKQHPKFSTSSVLDVGAQIDIYLTQNVPEDCIPEGESDPSGNDTPEGDDDGF